MGSSTEARAPTVTGAYRARKACVAFCRVGSRGLERIGTHCRLMMSTPASVESTPLGRPRGSNKMIELAPAVARAAESTGSGSGLLKYPPHADAAAVARSGRDDARSERGLGERAERGHCLTPSFFGLRAERTAGERAALQRRSGAKSLDPLGSGPSWVWGGLVLD
jgi:hypothetical protein